MFLLRSIPLCLSVLVFAGCSASPIPMARELVMQDALRGAAHWEFLAQETTADVIGCVEGLVVLNEETETYDPICHQDTAGLKGRSIYVELVDSATPFSRVFHEYMTTALVEAGQKVTLESKGALVVHTRLRFVNRRGVVPLNSVPGTYALLGTGIWALQDADVLIRLLGLGALTDAYVMANDAGGAQLVITTSLMDGDRFIMRRSKAFFIDTADFAHYASNAPTTDLLTPPKDGKAPSVKSLNVVAE